MPRIRGQDDRGRCDGHVNRRPKTGSAHVLASACAPGRAGRAAVHRRRAVRPVAVAQLSDRHRAAHGHRLCAAAAVLDPARPRRRSFWSRACARRRPSGRCRPPTCRHGAPVIFVTASLVVFGLSIERLGLVLSILLLIGDRRAGDARAAAAGDRRRGAGADRAVLGHLHSRARADDPGLAGVVTMELLAQPRDRLRRRADAGESRSSR